MRRIFIRTTAAFLGVASVWAIYVGAFNDMSLYKQVTSYGFTLMLLLYGFFGDRPTDWILGLPFGVPSAKPRTESDAPDEFQQRSNDEQS